MRYFIVTTLNQIKGNTFYTNLDVTSYIFINREELIESQRLEHGEDLICVILNIKELNEEDYYNHIN